GSNHNNRNVITITDMLNGGRNQSFGYDYLNRLTSASQTDASFNQTFSIDAWGNLRQSGTWNFNQSFDNTNRISGYSYDGAGNLLSDTFHSYSYDSQGRMK